MGRQPAYVFPPTARSAHSGGGRSERPGMGSVGQLGGLEDEHLLDLHVVRGQAGDGPDLEGGNEPSVWGRGILFESNDIFRSGLRCWGMFLSFYHWG